MSLDNPTNDKMMAAAPAKKEFHFAGAGIWHNMTILAEDVEKANARWYDERIRVEAVGEPNPAPEQSTPPAEPTEEING